MRIDFLKTVLDNPIGRIRVIDINPLVHDFDSENLSDRLYSLYSAMEVLVESMEVLDEDLDIDLITPEDVVVNIDTFKPILQKYDIELRFLRGLNSIRGDRSGVTPRDLVNKFYNEMVFNLRDRNLSEII